MSKIEQAWLTNPSRRNAIARVGGLIAASPIAAAMAQIDPHPLSQHHRVLSLPEMQTAFDFEPVFFENVTLTVFDYTAQGDGSEYTLRRNRQAFDWVDIVPTRDAVPASSLDLSSELLGVNLKLPIVVAPSAAQVPLHPDGEAGMFKAATAASNTLMLLSINTSIPVAQVAAAVPGAPLWGQYYPQQNLATTQRGMDTYAAAGVNTIIVTLDQQASYYERPQQDRNLGGRVRVSAMPAAAPTATGSAKYRINGNRLWYTWEYIDAVRKMVKGKLLVKGIVEPEDANLAIEHGVDGIIVSNHGGRSMDYGPSTLEALPGIVAAVNGRVPILFDSGVRRGADVFKAIALGANAVMLGRAARWGLAAYGIPGAQRVIEIIQQEFIQTAAAAGCTKLSDINKTAIKVNFP